MLKRFSLYAMPGLYFSPDGDGGGGGNQPTKTFTQEDVDRLVGEARKAGRETGVAKLLEGLGAKDADELKALLEEGKKAKDSQKTELEKLTEKITAAEAKAIEAEKRAADQVAAIQKRLVDSEIKMLAVKAIMDKDGKQVVRAAFRAEALDDVLDKVDRSLIKEENGVYSGIDKALETLAKAKPHWLAEAGDGKQKSYGSPSQPDRKPKQPDPQQPAAGRIIRSL